MQSEVPEPDYDDPKELWAFFGLTFYAAQVLEQGIVNLAVAARAAGNQAITSQLIEDLYGSFSRLAFGRVLRIVREMVTLPNHIDADLGRALEKRNHLAHSFFVVHDHDLLSEEGRRKMINILRDDLSFFKRVDSDFDPIWQRAWHDLGVTQDMVDRVLDSLGIKR